eukprot:scaffold400389_cov35-Prasinocladus_malaysianus.AAC.1
MRCARLFWNIAVVTLDANTDIAGDSNERQMKEKFIPRTRLRRDACVNFVTVGRSPSAVTIIRIEDYTEASSGKIESKHLVIPGFIRIRRGGSAAGLVPEYLGQCVLVGARSTRQPQGAGY